MNAELIVKLVPEEYRHGYTFTRNGIVTSLGKFEGESIATLYYYECSLNGGETVFEVTEEERLAFNIGKGYKAVYLYESDMGFVHLYFCSNMEEAQEMKDYDEMSQEEG